jgi:hypothetical protein
MGYSKLKKPIDSASVREAIANLGMENGRGRHLHWKTLPWIRRVLGESCHILRPLSNRIGKGQRPPG